jgi:hypothetical protein
MSVRFKIILQFRIKKTHPQTPSLEKRRGSLKSLSFQERDLG